MSKLLYAQKKVLRWCVGDTSVFSNVTPYGMLFTTMPAADGTGFVEPLSGNGYARLAISGKFGSPPVPASDGSLTNTAAMTWATATAPWLPIVGWGIVDASSGGNIIRAVPFTEAKTLGTSDFFTLDIGEAVLREAN